MKGSLVVVGLAVLLRSPPAGADVPPTERTSALTLGDWRFAPELQLRTQGEGRRGTPEVGGLDAHGAASSTDWAAGFFQRSRFGVTASHGALLGRITLQDARAWGGATALGRADSPFAQFGAHEAFIEVHSESNPSTYARIGRQAVRWGDAWLLSDADSTLTGRTFDALRARTEAGVFRVEALAALLAPPRPLGPLVNDRGGPSSLGRHLYGLSLGVDAAPLLQVDLVALARFAHVAAVSSGSPLLDAQSSGDTHTLAANVHGEQSSIEYGLSIAYQTGHGAQLRNGGREGRSAYAAALHVAGTFETLWGSPRVHAALNYASGDDGNGSYKQFDPLYPDSQQLGLMALFATSNIATGALGLVVNPGLPTEIHLGYRYARLANKRGEWISGHVQAIGSGASDEELGHEVDSAVIWKPWEALDLRASYGLLLLGAGAKSVMVAQQRGELADGAVRAPPLAHYAMLRASLSLP